MPNSSRKKAGNTDNKNGGHSGTAVIKPHAPQSGFGFARKKDVHDEASQKEAPRGPESRYDRTGDVDYAENLRSFENAGGSVPAKTGPERARSGNRKQPIV